MKMRACMLSFASFLIAVVCALEVRQSVQTGFLRFQKLGLGGRIEATESPVFFWFFVFVGIVAAFAATLFGAKLLSSVFKKENNFRFEVRQR